MATFCHKEFEFFFKEADQKLNSGANKIINPSDFIFQRTGTKNGRISAIQRVGDMDKKMKHAMKIQNAQIDVKYTHIHS